MLRRVVIAVFVAAVGSQNARLARSNEAITPVERLPEVEDVADGVAATASTALTLEQQRRERNRGERLIDRATDPTAWLMQYHFRDRWIVPTGDSGADENEFQVRPTIPFLAWNQVNIFRAEINYDVENSSGSGLNEVRLFDPVVIEEAWGRWGVGPGVQLQPNSSSQDEFAIGPAAAAVCKSPHWTVGFITETFLGNDVAQLYFEPILAYKFDDRWSLSVGEMKLRYDWRESEWTQLPLGCSLDYISDLWGQKVRWFANPSFNFRNSSDSEEWMLNFGLDLLAPDA